MKKRIIIVLSLMIIIAGSVVGQDYITRINCGGDSVEVMGVVFDPDLPFAYTGAGYVGGEPAWGDWGWSPWQIGGTNQFPLYSSFRRNFMGYLFEVPTGGYLVRLNLAEILNHGPDRRVLDIVIEDSTFLHSLDLYYKVGKDYAYVITAWARCSDGTLQVSTPASVGEPLLAGISVISWPRDSIPPGAPYLISATDGYNNTILFWEEPPELDIGGYRVQRRISGSGSWATILGFTPLHRYIDTTAVTGVGYDYRVAALDVFGNRSLWSNAIGPARAMSPSESILPIYNLFIDSLGLQILADDPWEDDYVDAAFDFDGTAWPDVEARYRGNVSRGVSKKNWKVKFPSTSLFEDERKINLNGEFMDASMLRNHYGYNLFRWAGIEAPYADFAHLELNDEYYGVYVRLEQVDEAYLRHRGHSELDPIYKCLWDAFSVGEDYSRMWEKETDCNWSDLEDIIELVNFTPDPEFQAAMDSAFDIESVLRYYAIVILIGDDDFSRHNIYLRRDLATYKWSVIPWDHNIAFYEDWKPLDLGTHFSPQTIGGPNVFLTRLMRVEDFRGRYCDLLDSLSTSLFTTPAAIAYLDSISGYIRRDVHADYRKGTHENNGWWEWEIGGISHYFNNRIEFVRSRMDSLRETTNRYGIYINELCAKNDSVNIDEHGDYDDWIELFNSNPWPVDLEGYFLSDDLDSLTKWELPALVIPAGGFLLLWLDEEPWEGGNHGPFKLDGDGEFLGFFKNIEGPYWWGGFPFGIDMVWFGEQTEDISWARYPDGAENWGFVEPTPGAPNDPTYVNDLLAELPQDISINSIYPNPFNSSCRIEIIAPPGDLRIEIFDITGRSVKSFGTEIRSGSAIILWDGKDGLGRELPSGVYFVKAVCDCGMSPSQKVVLIK